MNNGISLPCRKKIRKKEAHNLLPARALNDFVTRNQRDTEAAEAYFVAHASVRHSPTRSPTESKASVRFCLSRASTLRSAARSDKRVTVTILTSYTRDTRSLTERVAPDCRDIWRQKRELAAPSWVSKSL